MNDKKTQLTEKKNTSNGITLVALIITVILMLILVSVTICVLTYDEGIFTKTKKTAVLYELEAENENKLLSKLMNKLDIYMGKDNSSDYNEEFPKDEVLDKDDEEEEINSTQYLVEYMTFEYEIDPMQDINNDIIYEENETISSNGKIANFTGTVADSRLLYIDNNLNFGTNDFTIETWAYYTEAQTTPYTLLFSDNANANVQLFLKDNLSSNNVSLNISGVGRVIDTGVSYTDTMNQWVHYALVRNDGVFYIYQNGVNIGETSSYTTTNINLTNFTLGGNVAASTAYKGYIDNLAIYNIAKYTDNFTPSKSIDTNDLIFKSDFDFSDLKNEVGTNIYTRVGNVNTTIENQKYGEKSLYFSGENTANRIITTNENLNFGTNDFTMECWAYYGTQTTPYYSMLFADNANSAMQLFLMDYNSNNNISLNLRTVGRIIHTGISYTETMNQWVHYAVVRKDGVFYLYQNGINIGETDAYKTEIVNLSNYSFGGNTYTYTGYKGYIDNIAIYNFAKYTENFIPSE